MASASMNPAPNATECSMTVSPRANRCETASAPKTFPSAASTAYANALDMRQEIVLPVARRVLEHLGEEPLERRSDVGTRPHAGREQVVARHGKILQGQGVLGGADRFDNSEKPGNGKRETGQVQGREQGEQIVSVLTQLGKPSPRTRPADGWARPATFASAPSSVRAWIRTSKRALKRRARRTRR